MCSVRKPTIVASLLVLAAAALAVPPATAQTRPCDIEPCEPEPCSPFFALTHRQVTAIEFVKKKPNGVCVYECDANDTFSDLNMCPGSEDVTFPVGYRVRPFFGSFDCPGDPNHPEAGSANPGMCCATEPQPMSCSW
jgi:hypothetical protein